ncbi:hypothetical protein [Pantoea ananatis]|uniref:hypothetical protein n=1 Tax=Pantoea ananas TaxID=553 RepID=UPI0032EE6ADD
MPLPCLLCGDAAWQQAYDWLCRQRCHAPPDADVWDLRWRWSQEGPVMYRCVTAGTWRLSPMLVNGHSKEAQAMWSARDALVLKWVALIAGHQLPQHDSCMHLWGKGVRMSLSLVAEAMHRGRFRFVHRTDIRGYYQHIRKSQVINLVNRYVSSPVYQDLIRQYVHYSVEKGGEIRTPQTGIPRGCSLSLLIGEPAALY